MTGTGIPLGFHKMLWETGYSWSSKKRGRNEGKTAYDVAVELGYEECIKILEAEIR